MKINSNKRFAIAYRIFQSLGENPERAADYADKFKLSLCSVKHVVTILSRMGCIVAKRGGGKNSGIWKAPGVSVNKLFEGFNLPFQEGLEFEKRIDATLSNGKKKPKTCSICHIKSQSVNQEFLCSECVELDVPIETKTRLARCGHLSSTRYFKCEGCQPVLEDNMTPEDWGCGVSV